MCSMPNAGKELYSSIFLIVLLFSASLSRGWGHIINGPSNVPLSRRTLSPAPLISWSDSVLVRAVESVCGVFHCPEAVTLSYDAAALRIHWPWLAARVPAQCNSISTDLFPFKHSAHCLSVILKDRWLRPTTAALFGPDVPHDTQDIYQQFKSLFLMCSKYDMNGF